MAEHQAVEVRPAGRTPVAVSTELGKIVAKRSAKSWELQHVRPIIYNSLSAGYPILFFRREVAR